MTDIRMGAGLEFDLIRKLRERWGPLAVGMGDDASVLSVARGDRLVLSTDTAVDGVHFRRDWISMREIGYRAVTAALSDLAAMAAEPRGALVALTLPYDDHERLMELADGIGDAVRAAGTVVLGGNLVRGDMLAITTTAAGSAFSPLARSGGRPGDLLYVTGRLGGPATALRAFLAGKKPRNAALERFARPMARIAEARWLAARGAIAAIDVSDGLTSDAGHLAAASDVALEIQVERVPIFPQSSEADALAGGEEYELLVLARAPLPEAEFAERFGIPLTVVGRAAEGVAGAQFTRAGKRVAPPAGHDHFST
jgi:thiamine-monophosphate kinase